MAWCSTEGHGGNATAFTNRGRPIAWWAAVAGCLTRPPVLDRFAIDHGASGAGRRRGVTGADANTPIDGGSCTATDLPPWLPRAAGLIDLPSSPGSSSTSPGGVASPQRGPAAYKKWRRCPEGPTRLPGVPAVTIATSGQAGGVVSATHHRSGPSLGPLVRNRTPGSGRQSLSAAYDRRQSRRPGGRVLRC